MNTNIESMELNDNVRETRYLALFNLFENKDVFGGIPLFDFLCTSEGNIISGDNLSFIYSIPIKVPLQTCF